MRGVLLIAMVTVLAAASAALADWPQFMGSERNGMAKAGEKLARSWPEGGPKEVWSVKLGAGFGGPAVSDGKGYILDRIGNKQDVLRCLDLAKGEELWRYAYDAEGKLGYDGSRSTPAVDARYVFTIGAFGDVHCFDKTTHKPVWKVNIPKEFATKRPNWGYAQSPLLYKNTVIIFAGSKKVGLVAYNKATGKELWRSDPIGPPAYATPALMTVGGVDQLVVLPDGGARMAGIDAATGKILWTYRKWKCNIPIPTPTIIGGGRFFVTGGYGSTNMMLKVDRAGEKWTVSQEFTIPKLGSLLHSALLYKGYLYANCNTKRTADGLVCIDLAGNVKWKTNQVPNMERGNLIGADGLIYIMDGVRGVLRLVEPDPSGFKELAQAKVLRKGPIWAPMALTDGRLLCRDQLRLKCLDVSGK